MTLKINKTIQIEQDPIDLTSSEQNGPSILSKAAELAQDVAMAALNTASWYLTGGLDRPLLSLAAMAVALPTVQANSMGSDAAMQAMNTTSENSTALALPNLDFAANATCSTSGLESNPGLVSQGLGFIKEHKVALGLLALGALGYSIYKASQEQTVSVNASQREYKKENFVDSKGRSWKSVSLTLAEDLSEEDVDLAFEKFKNTMLDKVGLQLVEGDLVEWSLGETIRDEIQVNLKTKRENYTGSKSETLILAETHPNLAMFELLKSNAKSQDSFAPLKLEKSGKLPVAPVGFKHEKDNCTLNSMMQAMLANHQFRQIMEKCGDSELEKIAKEYNKLLKEGQGGLLDLHDVRKNFAHRWWKFWEQNPAIDLSQGQQDSLDYFRAILKKMGNSVNQVYVKRIYLSKWDDAESQQRLNAASPELAKMIIQFDRNKNFQVSLTEELKGDEVSSSTYFEHAPEILPIEIKRKGSGELAQSMEIPLVLQFPKEHLINKPAEDVSYELQSFTLYQGNGDQGHEISYLRTIELINDKRQEFYWLIDDMSNYGTPRQGSPQPITQNEFTKAAGLCRSLFYQRSDTAQALASHKI